MNESIGKCEKGEDRPSVKPTDKPYCSDGSQVVYETINGRYSCRTGTLITSRCPSGYIYDSVSFEGTSMGACVWNNPYKTTNIITNCSSGKYYSYKNSCRLYKKTSPSYRYKCGSGYTLKDDKCYEN